MTIFLREAVALEVVREKRAAVTMRAAYHAEADDFKKLLDS
jgi:hypothetical protein